VRPGPARRIGEAGKYRRRGRVCRGQHAL